jgi:hypothetical protein
MVMAIFFPSLEKSAPFVPNSAYADLQQGARGRLRKLFGTVSKF